MRLLVAGVLVLAAVLLVPVGALPLQVAELEQPSVPNPAPEQDAPQRDAPRLDPLARPAPGNPLARAPPSAWLPIIMGGGSTAEAAANSSEPMRTSYHLHPLGDVNGDARADFMLVTTTGPLEEEREDFYADDYEEEEPKEEETPTVVTLTGIAGGSYATLWTRTLPREAYWYDIGDVNGDGVNDFVLATSEDGGERFDCTDDSMLVLYAYSCSHESTETYEVFSGATGAAMLTREGSFRFAYESRDLWAEEVEVDQGSYEFTYTFLEPVPPGAFHGVDLVTITYASQGTWAEAAVVGAGLYESSDAARIERIGADGEPRWVAEFGDEGRMRPVDNQDYTGDGVPDWLLVGSAALEPPVQPYVGYGGGPEQEVLRVALLDGASGLLAWDVKTEPFFGDGFVTPGGRRGEGQRVALLHTFGKEATEEWGTRITALDGATGMAAGTATWVGETAFAWVFADADGDGAEDLFLVRQPAPEEGSPLPTQEEEYYFDEEPEWSLAVVKPDYAVLWELDEKYETGYGFYGFLYGYGFGERADFDDDGVPDLTAWVDERGGDGRLVLLSGASGEPLWSIENSEDNFGLSVLDDVTQDGGADVALTTFDIPGRDERDEYNHYPGFVEVRRGKDLELAWRKQVHDPALRPNVTGDYAQSTAFTVGDLSGDGRADILFSFDSYGCCGFHDVIVIYLEERDGGREAEAPDEEATLADDEDERFEPLAFALVLDGARGDTLREFPEGYMLSAALAAPADVGPAALLVEQAPPPSKGLIPGFEAALAALGLVALAFLRRRR